MTPPEPGFIAQELSPTPLRDGDTGKIAVVDDRRLPSPREIRTRRIVGIPIAMTDYTRAMDVMDGMIARGERGYVCCVAVHAVMVAQSDPEMRAALVGSTLTVPDGMPLVWTANLMGETLPNRVYGPELMRRYNERCRDRGHRVWLYGGRDQGSLAQLALNMHRAHPGIRVVGGYSPPFRTLTRAEENELARQINAASPDVLWVGIGVPKQEKWMAAWMQQRGLEWTYRLAQEPRRLLPRYLYYNPRFMRASARQLVSERRSRSVLTPSRAGR